MQGLRFAAPAVGEWSKAVSGRDQSKNWTGRPFARLRENLQDKLSSDLLYLKPGRWHLIAPCIPRVSFVCVAASYALECGSSIYFAPRPKRTTLKVAKMIARSSLRE